MRGPVSAIFWCFVVFISAKSIILLERASEACSPKSFLDVVRKEK